MSTEAKGFLLSMSCVITIAASTTAHSAELKIYWSVQQDTILRRSNVDGTQLERLIRTPGGSIPDIAFDPIEQKMYWPSAVAGGIQRGNYDGSDAETVITGLKTPTTVAIDSVHRKAYWIDYGVPSTIWRGNLDGSDRELLVTTHTVVRDVQVDPLHGYYYWCEQVDGTIHRTSLDNLRSTIIFDQSAFGLPGLPVGLAVDAANGYLYATDIAFQAILRMGLDGSDPSVWVTRGVSYPYAIVVDPIHQRVIWSNDAGLGAPMFDTNISSVNFQGTDQRVDFIPDWNGFLPGFVRHLAIVEVPVPEPGIAGLGAAFLLVRMGVAIARRPAPRHR